jgi:hypothetical protein
MHQPRLGLDPSTFAAERLPPHGLVLQMLAKPSRIMLGFCLMTAPDQSFSFAPESIYPLDFLVQLKLRLNDFGIERLGFVLWTVTA